ncbi:MULTISPECIES: hypothetical protein [Burkholderiaceae]|jgi:hypothetical protein|uniref:Uncharacterized protein n=2 Tax=Caballeronia TaxID=1827195 RepID=A0A242MY22_CABSO|nr:MULTISPECIES: hypothetical protein [Burkholderiaceae]AMM15776.1 hypothetical protein AX768_16015 [Burkholderia sp. PAMC 28687]MDP9155588.1 hypothetical protein [Pseudomonadota bacterium]OTP76331.1 hypothetical protein PAMC26510_11775 [Caballeronia sordidicola]
MRFGLKILAKVVLAFVAVAALGWLVMTLWNWVVPALFIGARVIDFPHALGLMVLSRILFGGFRGHGGGWRGRRQWRRWEQMTPEEREQFKSRRCGVRKPREADSV